MATGANGCDELGVAWQSRRDARNLSQFVPRVGINCDELPLQRRSAAVARVSLEAASSGNDTPPA
jgi:hypothetical protein